MVHEDEGCAWYDVRELLEGAGKAVVPGVLRLVAHGRRHGSAEGVQDCERRPFLVVLEEFRDGGEELPAVYLGEEVEVSGRPGDAEGAEP